MNLKKLNKDLKYRVYKTECTFPYDTLVIKDNNTVTVSPSILDDYWDIDVEDGASISVSREKDILRLLELLSKETLDVKQVTFKLKDLTLKIDILYNDNTIYFGKAYNKMYMQDNNVYLNDIKLANSLIKDINLYEYFRVFIQGFLVTRTYEEYKEISDESITRINK